LYQTADGYRYDFSAISTDVLGGIYEQYLGYVQEKKEADEKKKSKRKSQGIYYTPKYIVEYLIEQTLGEVLKKAKVKDIPNIKILDPACGSGSFLITAYDKMLEAKTKLDKQTGLFDRFEILKNNIYGVDLDEQAIEIAQLNLLLRVLQQRTKLPTLSHNLKVGNSLVTGSVDELKKYFGETYREQRPFNYSEEFKEVFDENGFDVVIGNPPWVSLKGKHKSLDFSEEELKYFYEKLNANTYAPNLYEMFIWRGLSLLKEGGYFSFIVPDRLCANRQFIKLREHILKNYTLKSLWFNVDFPGIIADTVIFVIQNKKPRANKIKVVEYPNSKFEKIPQSLYLSQTDFSFFYVPEIILAIFEKIKSNPKVATLDQFVKTTSGCGAKSSLLHESKESEAEIKVMKGANICRYGNKGYFWFEFKDENLSGRTRDEKKLSVQNKILLRKTGIDLIATFNDSGIYPEQSLYFAYDSDKETLLYLLAILNSRLMNTYYHHFAITNRDSTPQLKNVDLDKFPIIKPTDKQKIEITKLAQLMLDLQEEALKTTENTDKHNRLKTEIEKLDEKIDRAIYKLYELTDDEIKTVQTT
ncbi:N-6 DNA methylase, partial [Candidatus Peregrinibacteria bacterium]|nr:N-6 DNA methylase [Candidatus Peregrinibacteria bacterium]